MREPHWRWEKTLARPDLEFSGPFGCRIIIYICVRHKIGACRD
jgi:hypothetical protein